MFARTKIWTCCTVLGCLTLAACSMNLRPEPVQTADFSGVWVRDTARSDDVAAKLKAAFKAAADKQAKKRRGRRGGPGPEGEGPYGLPSDAGNGPPGQGSNQGPNPGPGQGGQPSWWQREQSRQEEEFINAVNPPAQLRITQTAGRVELVSTAGGARRTFDPERPSSLITIYATLRIESGWQGNVFVVHSQDSSAKMEITERYSLTPSGDLQEQILLDMPEAKKQNYRVLFKRAQG